MKLGVLSAIYDDFSFEEMIDDIAKNGCVGVEVACWPQGGASRRYAGTSHIDVSNTSAEYVASIKSYCEKKGVQISSLAFYPNTLDGDLEKRQANIEHLKKVIHMSALLDVNMVTTFVGRDQTKTVDENIEIFKNVWPAIIEYAKSENVKIAIENCPMLFGVDQWPGGQNLFSTPNIWRRIFDIVDSDYFGINYDPSHFIWQQIDYIKPLYEFKDKIFHVHCKDIKLYRDKLEDVGVMAYPIEYMSPKLPGLGDVDWGKYVSALTDVGYDGFLCIEVEDKAFESSREKILDAVELSARYLKQFII